MNTEYIILAAVSLVTGWCINSIYRALSSPSPRCDKCGIYFEPYLDPSRRYIESTDQVERACKACHYVWHETPVIVADRRTDA